MHHDIYSHPLDCITVEKSGLTSPAARRQHTIPRVAMQTRIEAKTLWRVDFALYRTARTKKSRMQPNSRSVLRSPSPGRASSSRPLRGLMLSRSTLPARLTSISATLADLTKPISDSEGSDRDLGWPRTFAEKFQVESEILGEGSFGVVRPAVKRETGKRHAVKFLPKNTQGDWDRYSALLQREVTHWKQLQDCQQVVHLEGVYEVVNDSHHVS